MGDELANWAKSASAFSSGGADDDARRADFNAASFELLSAEKPELARRLSASFVDVFLGSAHLSPRRRDEALAMLVLESGVTPIGQGLLQVRFPFTGSTTTTEWDGSDEDAEDIITSLAISLAEDVEGDRSMSGPTGWEAEDEGESST